MRDLAKREKTRRRIVFAVRRAACANQARSWLAAALLASLPACDGPAHPDGATAGYPAPKVKIALPVSEQVTVWDEYTGRIEAVEAVEIRARVSGYLEKVNFSAGAKVKKGDLLFVIDPKPFKAQLEFAEAELEQARAKQALAKNDLLRAESLYKAKAISAEEYDARHKGLREVSAAVQAAAAQVDSARLNLQYTQVRAPIDGRISREYITAGNLVNGGGADATRLASVVSIDPVYVYADVDERALLHYRRQAQRLGRELYGTEVQLALADEQGFPHTGRLDYIAPQQNPGTGTVSIRGVFANHDELLSPGFFARMRIRSGAPHAALLLPERAIASDQAERFVWVLGPDKKAVYRRVTPGAKIGSLRVISQGLQAGEWVVIEGLQKLKAGAAVDAESIALSAPDKEQ
ncbi:MAG: efflux RND transporter periplasmic adaptor subunit [Gammaproteobacteria bacterium]